MHLFRSPVFRGNLILIQVQQELLVIDQLFLDFKKVSWKIVITNFYDREIDGPVTKVSKYISLSFQASFHGDSSLSRAQVHRSPWNTNLDLKTQVRKFPVHCFDKRVASQ